MAIKGRIEKIVVSLIIFICQLSFGQISGTVTDEANQKPIPYTNIWIKNTQIGATTGKNGEFHIDRAKIGDSIFISSLGYNTVEFLAIKENDIVLKAKINELEEVVVIPMKNTFENAVISFKKPKKNRKWYHNGHYSLARFYENKLAYQETPFISEISLITLNAKKENVIFRIRLVEVGQNGEPSENGLTENIILESRKGVNKIIVDVAKEKILFPNNGFFVVVDRLNLKENKFFNKIARMDILQPAIGLELTDQEKNTWLGYGGRWIPPSEMTEFLGSNGNIAINVKLTN